MGKIVDKGIKIDLHMILWWVWEQNVIFYENCIAFECLPVNELKCWDSVRLDFRTYLTYFHLVTLGCLSIKVIMEGLLFGIKTFAQDGLGFLKICYILMAGQFLLF